MKKKELLSPVGNFESLKMAVYHGCDAVYLGGKRFGARAFAANFSDDEMKESVFFCHLYGVKLYVTVNTMIYESELQDVLDYVKFLYEIHVDAVIMADVGLIHLVHEMMPLLEIHVSTQLHIHNVEQIGMLRDLGVKRVVLARELSLEEISQFPDDLDIEVFVHGALCISYSGQCLFSSFLMHRSGNRGECAQICRLPFQLLENGKPVFTKGSFLLSTKDLNTSNRFQDLMNSNVTSFKIEGRMKSPAYVGFMTQFYRRLISRFQREKQIFVDSQDTTKAALLFGRGFTEGCLFSKKDQDFVNQETSNHQGVMLGRIEVISSKKVGIRLVRNLHQGDGIRFASTSHGMIVNFLYDEKGKLISEALEGELIFLDNKFHLEKKVPVLKTFDVCLEEEILSVTPKKIPIWMKLRLTNPTIFIEIGDGEHTISVSKDIICEAKSKPLSKDMVWKQFSKLGDTPFCLEQMDIILDENLFTSVGQLNQIRREAMEQLKEIRVQRESVSVHPYKEEICSFSQSLEIYATATTEEQLLTLLPLGLQGIYVSDYSLYQTYREQGVIYRTNRVAHHVPEITASSILASESGSFYQFQGEKSIDYFFNVSNHAAVDYWVSKSAKRVCLSPEMTLNEVTELLKHYPNGNPCEILIYGRLEVMVLNHCIMRMNLHSKGICKLCKENVYSLQDRNGAQYPIRMDQYHRTHLFYHSKFNYLNQLSSYYELGIRKFRLEFFDETVEEIQQIVSQVRNKLNV